MNKNSLVIIGIILLSGIGIAIAVVPVMPPSFTYQLPILPLPSIQNQTFMGSCKYILPIQFKDIKVFDVNGTNLQPIITYQIRVYTDNKRNICSQKKTVNLPTSITSNDLVNNLTSAISIDLINQVNQHSTIVVAPDPISTT